MSGALERAGPSAARPSVAIAGAGWVSHHCYRPALAENGLRLSAVADPDLEAARRLVAEAGEGEAVSEAGDLLRYPADLMVIATPNALHAPLSRSALAAGFRVLCEKPLALSRADVEDLLVDGSGRLAVSCPYRFREDIQALAGLARSGDLGEIYRVRLSWDRARGVPQPGSWYTQRRISGGGVLADLGPHLIDLALLFTGHPQVLEVSAWTGTLLSGSDEYASSWMSSSSRRGDVVDVEDQASLLLKLASGVAEIHVSWAGHRGCDSTRLELEGTRGRAVLKTLLGYSTEGPVSPPRLDVFRAGGATSRELPFERRPATDFGRMLRACLDGGSVFPGVATGEQALAVVDVLERAYADAGGRAHTPEGLRTSRRPR